MSAFTPRLRFIRVSLSRTNALELCCLFGISRNPFANVTFSSRRVRPVIRLPAPAVRPVSFSFPVWTCVCASLWHITRWQLSHSFNWLAGDGRAGGQRRRKQQSRQRKWETPLSVFDSHPHHRSSSHLIETPSFSTVHWGVLWLFWGKKINVRMLEAQIAQRSLFYVVGWKY